MTGVSYIATIYNKAPYLEFLVSGLKAQKGDFEREFIFVDDGSTDDSLSRLRHLTSDLPNVTILTQANLGPGVAAAAGLAHATLEFVKPLGGDDLMTVKATSSLLSALTETGVAVAFGGDGVYRLGAGVTPEKLQSQASEGSGTVRVYDDALRRSLRRAQFPLSACLARTEVVRAVGGCDTRVIIPDYPIELNLACVSPFAFVDTTIFLQPESAPGRVSDNQAQTRHDMNLALANFIGDHPDLEMRFRRLALERASGRAWLWARRKGGKGFFSLEFARHIAARIRLLEPTRANIEATCEIFRRTGAAIPNSNT